MPDRSCWHCACLSVCKYLLNLTEITVLTQEQRDTVAAMMARKCANWTPIK